MTKEEIYQMLIDCRLVADEVCTGTLLVPNAQERFELNWHAKKVLDEIDCFMNCLHKMGVDTE